MTGQHSFWMWVDVCCLLGSNRLLYKELKHTNTLFYLSDHYIREWRVIVDQAQTNYHGRPMDYNQSGVTDYARLSLLNA